MQRKRVVMVGNKGEFAMMSIFGLGSLLEGGLDNLLTDATVKAFKV
jgi:hypothetical protein